MPATYEPIATTTLGSTATSITFSSIPATYTDLRLIVVSIGNVSTSIKFNNDSSSIYSYTYLKGNGTSAGSGTQANDPEIPININSSASSTIPSLVTVDVFSYAGSTNKTILGTASTDLNGSGEVNRIVGLYRSATAISRIDVIRQGTGTFAVGTTATLYGILKA